MARNLPTEQEVKELVAKAMDFRVFFETDLTGTKVRGTGKLYNALRRQALGEKMENLFNWADPKLQDRTSTRIWAPVEDPRNSWANKALTYHPQMQSFQSLIDHCAEKSNGQAATYLTENNESYLMLAARFNHPDLVEAMLNSKKITLAALSLTTNEGKTIDQFIQEMNNPRITARFNEVKAEKSAMAPDEEWVKAHEREVRADAERAWAQKAAQRKESGEYTYMKKSHSKSSDKENQEDPLRGVSKLPIGKKKQ